MKNSGIEWIGEIPVEWKTSLVKHSIRWKSIKGQPEATVLSLYRDYGIIPKDSRDDNHNVTSLDTSTYKVVSVGDFVINKMKAWQGSMAVSGYEGIISPAYHVCEITNSNIDKKYFHHLMRNHSYLPEYTRLSTGMRIGQWDLGFDDFRNIPFIIPPIEEQKRIVSFIDKKCAEIDAVIEKTKATIEEYKKLKQSVITEAVTKGIRGNRTTKDSGIEWLEQIPAEWEIYRFKKLFSFGKGLSITKENLIDTGLSVISYGQIHSKTNTGVSVGQDLIRFVSEDYLQSNSSSLVNKGDFIFADTSEDLDGCGNCVYVDKEMTLFAGYHTIIAFSKSTNNRYLAYLFKTNGWRSQIRSRVSGVKLFSISKKILANTTLIMPPDEEQLKITDYLDKKCAEIDTLIARKTNLLTELETYKKSLIYEYVTGKKEVGEVSDNTTVAIVYPCFPAVLSTKKARFAQAVLMSKILDSNVKHMGRVKLEKMLFTIEHSLGFNFDTEYVREMAGPLDGSIYECEKIVSRTNKWFYVNNSQNITSYKPQKNMRKYKKYYEQYFSDYNEEIENIINIFENYSLEQSEIVATLFAAWNDAIIDKKKFTDEDIVNDILTNWHESKTRFSKDVWLRAMDEMRKNSLVPKGYGKKTVIRN